MSTQSRFPSIGLNESFTGLENGRLYLTKNRYANPKYFNMNQSTNQVAPEILAQQKTYKEAKEHFRSTIKTLVDEQRTTKFHRTPSNYSIDIKDIPAAVSRAQSRHHLNRVELRHLYLAYAIMRTKHGGYTKLLIGTSLDVLKDVADRILSGKADDYRGLNPKFLTSIYEKYAPKTVHINP